ncbi:unnamed protein product [Rhizoctonia solani]|uniref:Uncharacterized protein n=1 Tax=Rhizoctonia solani TaxID=456999 RepID=A0A8H2WFE3_9AGAM|nr:unnamed protein product [Rhizoctonia solani]
MSHPGSKSILQRMFRSAISGSRFRAGQRSKEHHALKEHKAVVCESHMAAPRAARIPCHMSYWDTVDPENQTDANCDSHERKSYPPDVHEKPSRLRRDHKAKLSSPIPRTRRSFDMDKFIRENESWTPPSPTENLSRRLFREAQQPGIKPQNTSIRPSGDYLVRRPMKEYAP